MEEEKKKEKGVSTDVNWQIFRHSWFLFISSIVFCVNLLGTLNTKADEVTKMRSIIFGVTLTIKIYTSL